MTIRRLLPATLCVASLAFAACGGSTQTESVTSTAPAATTPVTQSSTQRTKAATSATKAAKRKARKSPKRQAAPDHAWCDANIRVKTATMTCRFAQNVFLAYWTSQNYDGFATSAYSPAAHREFAVDCTAGEGHVVCTAGDGAEVTFPQSAVDRYSLAQAKRYVAASNVGDDIFPWEQPSGGSSDAGPSSPGTSSPGTSVPDTSSTPPGENIPNYENGRGYRVQCADGTYSHSGGMQGACSHHGGVG